jgi:hypothetical protein
MRRKIKKSQKKRKKVKSNKLKNPQQNRDIKIGVKLIESLQIKQASHIACRSKLIIHFVRHGQAINHETAPNRH